MTVATIPTGGGKTFTGALIAMIYKNRGKRVTFITTDNYLVDQASSMIGDLRQELNVQTMEEALLRLDEFDVFILDEADHATLSHGCAINSAEGKVYGFWDMFRKRTILMSATIGDDLKDVLH